MKNRDISVKYLKEHLAFFEKGREDIVDQWIGRQEIKAFFKKFNISPSSFKKTFGLPILDYFLGVIEGRNSIGDCPVVHKLILYLIERDIHSPDIYTLCMGLRRSILSRFFSQKNKQDKIEPFLEEMSDVFDANLVGVLNVFAQLSREREAKLQHEVEIHRAYNHIQAILNFQENLLCVVKDERIIVANKAFLHAFGVKSLDELHSEYPDYRQMVAQLFEGNDAFSNQRYTEWLEEMTGIKDRSVVIYLNNKREHETKAYLMKVNRLPNMPSEYIISMAEVTHIDSELKKIKQDFYQDPVTNVYNSAKFDEALAGSIAKNQRNDDLLFILFIDLDNLGVINDRYGQVVRDTILIKCAGVITEVKEDDMLLARIRSGRFALLCQGYERRAVLSLAYSIRKAVFNTDYVINEKLNCSIAVTRFRPPEPLQALLKRTDKIIEEIKENGGGKVWDDEITIEKDQKLQEEERLILESLASVFKRGTPLKITATYKEIPITSDMKIVALEEDRIVMQAVTNFSFYFSRDIYFQLPYPVKNISANIVDQDPKEKMITLSNFRYLESSPLDRKFIRVRPGNDIYITIKNRECLITGIVQDISLVSVSIFADSIDKLHTGDSVVTNFYVFRGEQEVDISAEGNILDIEKVKNIYRIIVVFNLSRENDAKLSEYISEHQRLIIQDFKQKLSAFSCASE